jgi:uroporphyrinogen-III synthase
VTSLAGRRILVTRRPGQAAALVQALRDRGAEVIELPAIETAPPEDTGPLDDALGHLARYDWVAFTSANAVEAVRDRLRALGLAPSFRGDGPRVASVGASTSEAWRAAFPDGRIDLQPEGEFRAGGLLRAFTGTLLDGARVLLPASDRARDELPQGLRGLGATVDVVEAYRTVEPAGLAEAVTRCINMGFGAATFASPSAVEGFAKAAGPRVAGLPVVVIGPTTEAAARAAGMDVLEVAHPSTAEGLLAALERMFALPP